MKIAFIVSLFPTLSETFILNQITGLIDLGHHVDIFSQSSISTEKIHQDIKKYQLNDNLYYLDAFPGNKLRRVIKAFSLFVKYFVQHPKPTLASLNFVKYGNEALSLRLFYKVIPFLNDKYDILQCHFGPNGNLGIKLKRLGIKGKIVTMFHGTDVRVLPEKNPRIYDQLFIFGDLFLANSNYTFQRLRELGLMSKKLLFHPVGIDINKFSSNCLIKEHREIETIEILTVARLEVVKGISYAIKAIKVIRDQRPNINLRYNIVGEGPEEKKLKKLVTELKLDNCIKFWGGMTQEDVIIRLNNAHIFLLPSLEEAFGTVLLEAQAMNLPIVASSVGGISMAVRNGVTGYLVPATKMDAISEKLLYLIEHPKLRITMGKEGRKYVSENYDIALLNRKLMSYYNQLIDC